MLRIEAVEPGPDEEALYRELFAPLARPMPVSVSEPPSEGGPGHWTAPAGVLAAREDGALLAWVVYFAQELGSARAVLQWVTVERERQRITTGYNTEHPGTAAEVDTLAALATEAARAAAAAGYTRLRWQPAEPDLAEGLARRLRARTEHEDGFTFYELPLRRP
ncbi:hypothetical protein ACEZDB_36350 [Streptacidiphilus sp. N1-3]|uniref:N-acetyltransferase domain-containing protein n=1 Tax=Streptacidiphilus alkalitolerans TaxID=3342712 RepID=A0ABV6XCY7_9ACTN